MHQQIFSIKTSLRRNLKYSTNSNFPLCTTRLDYKIVNSDDKLSLKKLDQDENSLLRGN